MILYDFQVKSIRYIVCYNQQHHGLKYAKSIATCKVVLAAETRKSAEEGAIALQFSF